MIDLKELGITQDEIVDRVVEKVADSMLHDNYCDKDGNPRRCASELDKELRKRIEKEIDRRVDLIATEHVLPKVASMFEGLCFQETNKWGEKKGEPVTFVEYLVGRAEAYLTEKVNSSGKTRAEDSYSWNGTQTRVTYLVNQHLQYAIETAMKQAIANANKVIVGGIEETVKAKLAEVTKSLSVSVKV